jgi:hypothetical protein
MDLLFSIPRKNMKNYVDEGNRHGMAATPLQNDSGQYLSSAANPELRAGTILLEKDNPESPRLRVTAGSTRAGDGSWLTPVETVMQEFNVRYSFITFTHSTIAGAMTQEAATREEAIDKVRAWLTMIYQPVEFDYVTV